MLGNTLPLWLNVKDAMAGSEGFEEMAIRSMLPGREFMPHIRRRNLRIAAAGYKARNACRDEDMIFSIMDDPTNTRWLSFEYRVDEYGRDVLKWSAENLLHRECMARSTIVTGPSARLMLMSALHPTEYDALMEVHGAFPTACIEATMYERPCGVQCTRMIVWEVRDY